MLFNCIIDDILKKEEEKNVWTGYKRKPNTIDLNLNDENHINFIQ